MTSAMEWRVCAGFPNYEVSECGDMRRITPGPSIKVGTRLRGFIDQDGYLHYVLRDGEGRKTHRGAHVLVAATFIGPPPTPAHEVAHQNGSRIANHFSNLRWSTRLENHRDMVVHGTGLKGTSNGRARLSEADVLEIRSSYRAIKNRMSDARLSDLDRRFGISRSHLTRVARGEAWSHVPMQEAY